MKVVMIGSGYVGLVSGACFAEFGADVHCVDIDENKIAQLQAGVMPIYEPGLDSIVARNTAVGRLVFTTSFETVAAADLVFIAVGTPSRHNDGYAELSHVYNAVRLIAPHLRGYTVVVDKSTVPVGTARQVQRILRDAAPNADFEVASNPEFLREGAAIADFMRPDRVVIGVESERSAALLQRLYRPLNLIEVPMIVTSLQTAELIKYAANAFLATKISFINEIANLCEAVDADVHDVSRGIGLDGRIGRKFLHPGPGYGGSCLPKDMQALARMGQEHSVPLRIVEAGIETNVAQRARMVRKLRAAIGGDEASKTIAVLGLTFKPETDDMRDAPSLAILPRLHENGARIQVHDPQGLEAAMRLLPPGIIYCDDVYVAVRGADALLVLTEWNAYRGIDLSRVKQEMKGDVVVDLRNIYDPAEMARLGFSYTCVGRPSQLFAISKH